MQRITRIGFGTRWVICIMRHGGSFVGTYPDWLNNRYASVGDLLREE